LAGSAAGIVKEILLCIEGDRLRVLHLASGSGRLSSAVLSVLSSDTELLRRIILHLVDYSESALSSAKIQLNNYGVDIRTHTRDDEECLNDAIQRGHKYHVVMVSAHLHRKAFLDAYLGLLQQVLEPDGVLVITDLHSVLTHHPLHLVSLFEEHGIEGSRIDLLRELFGPLLAPGSCELTSQEIQSMTDHRTYLGRVVTEAKRYSGPKDHPVFVLGGFVSSRQLCTALDRAGMTTDVSEIAKAFPRARLPASLPVMLRAGSDSAAVTIATLRRVRA
jgi:ubiquinone/menaquinone biosynthesis C-methylase UbiE